MLGMSQTDLGQAADVSFQQIQKYENGTNRVSAGRMQQFAKLLNVPVSFFFDGGPDAQVIGGQKTNAKGAVTPAYVTDFLTSREGQDIMKAFHRLDRKLCRAITNLAEYIAANNERSR